MSLRTRRGAYPILRKAANEHRSNQVACRSRFEQSLPHKAALRTAGWGRHRADGDDFRDCRHTTSSNSFIGVFRCPHSRCEKIEVPGEKTVTRCIYDPLDIAKFKHGVAHWNHKDVGIQVFMTLQVANGELVVETVDVFDKHITGQTNMLIKDSFRKAERVPTEPVVESAGR